VAGLAIISHLLPPEFATNMRATLKRILTNFEIATAAAIIVDFHDAILEGVY
jgi:hypothetical protein